MSRQDDLRKLLKDRYRYLQIVKEKEARYGLDTPAYLLLEKQDTESEIARLEQELAELIEAAQAAPPTPPPRPPRPAGSVPPAARPLSPALPPQSRSQPVAALLGGGTLVIILLVAGLIWFTRPNGSGSPPPTAGPGIPSDIPTPVSTLTPTSQPEQPTQLEPQFERIIFAQGFENLEPVDAALTFAAGVIEIHAIFDYRGMSPTDTWTRIWYLDGQKVSESARLWEAEAEGIFHLTLDNQGQALPPGNWRLELYVNHKLLQVGGFTISDR